MLIIGIIGIVFLGPEEHLLVFECPVTVQPVISEGLHNIKVVTYF